MRVSELPLNALYERPKITPSVEAAILLKEDFSAIAPTYCEKVCRLKCKAPPNQLLTMCGEVDILIVQDHEAPMAKFDKQAGQSERVQQGIIQLIAKKAGLDNLTCRVVSLLKCAPTEDDFPRGKSPTATTILKCRPYLYAEIAATKPKVIISLSTVVTKALGLKKYSNTGNRGQVVNSAYGQVVISLHPRILTMIRQTAVGASGFWSADYFEVIRRDFEKAGRIARGTLIVPTLPEAVTAVSQRITICRSLEDVTRYCEEIETLPANTLVSWDLETTGLNGFDPKAKILCSQFGYKIPGDTDYKSVVFPLWHRSNIWYEPDEAWVHIARILTGPVKKIGWNVKFDCVYCAGATGLRPKNVVFDGLLVQHLMDSGANGTFSLKVAVSDFMPESGLQGYEDLLPKLGSVMPDEVSMEEEE